MGAWGHDPVESDQGQEFYLGALAGIEKKIRRALKSRHPQDPLCAAFLLDRIGFLGVYPGDLSEDLTAAVDKLQAILDAGNTNGWRDYERRHTVVLRLLTSLRARQADPRVPGTRTLGEKLHSVTKPRPQTRKREGA